MADRSDEYQGFRYWLVQTTTLGQKFWRIEFPGGHKTPPLPLSSEADVKAEIDKIIAQSQKAG